MARKGATDDCLRSWYTEHCDACVQVYASATALMRVGGWGPVRDLAAPVMQCLLLELYSPQQSAGAAAPAPKSGGKQAKKRKRSKGNRGADDLAGISSGSTLLTSQVRPSTTSIPNPPVMTSRLQWRGARMPLWRLLKVIGWVHG